MSFLRRFSVAVSKKLTVTTTSEPSQDFGLATLSAIMSVGCVALILMTFFGNYPETHSQWGNIGLAMSIGLCSLLCGGFMGFLFGIPRTLQKAALDTGESGRSIKERAYGNNTNLEQISDWLTKIIVGVSLTQLPAIQKGFVAIASSVADGFAFFSPKMALAFAGTLIVFYSVCGFLYVYLWCKIYFIRQLETQDQDMAKVYARVEKVTDDLNRKIEDNKENSARNLRISELNRRIMNFEKAVTRLLTSENTIPELKEWLQTFRPKRPLIEDDIQKGRWGGLASAEGFSLTAIFGEPYNDEDGKHKHFPVRLIVEGDAEHILTGNVYFFLHDSYEPKNIVAVKTIDGKAALSIASYEAFTVGVLCNEGRTALELDLNLFPGSPEDYKYEGALTSIESLGEERDLLLAAELPKAEAVPQK